jgi:Tol biopolymer transport system component
MGTAAYMSPEQARGKTVDKRADIWAFGVVLYEMLTGRQLFEGETVSDTLARVLTKEPDWDRAPAKTRRLLRRCLEKDPKRRLRDIGDAWELPEEPPVESPSHSALPWAVAAVAILAAAGLAVVHFRQTPPQPVPIRFQIPAPDKTNLSGNSGMALSPDGRRLAFVASGPDGRGMIWVRALDSLAAQALPGTEGAPASAPFWSPDSRFIGFAVRGKLNKIEASGGPPQTLCELSANITGGSWSRDGVIVLGTPTGGLFRVPQAGGVATQFTAPDASLGETGHWRPWFLPDGRHFLYATNTRKAEDSAIYLATLDSKDRKRLVAARQAAAYAPPPTGSENGHLLFLRAGTLMAQPLDAKRFELTGEPFPVAEQVGSYYGIAFFSVSANGVLAYRSGSSLNSQLVWFDRGGKSLGSLGAPALYDGGLALSPDGKRVAVGEGEQIGNRDIWLLDVARGVHTRFTFDAQSSRPTWSPDGARLAFVSYRGESGNEIYQKDSGGSGSEELLSKSGFPEDWSLDGRLLYSVSDPKTKGDLWVLPVQAGTPESHKPRPYLQTPFTEAQGRFSPDGHWVAYASDESGQYQIYVQSFPAGAGKFQVSTGGGGTQPRWRRDGKEIFYLAADGKLMAVEAQTASRFEAGVPKALFDPMIPRSRPPPWVFYFYDVTADGKRFLVNSISTAPESSASAPITVVVNWLALKR